MPAEPALLFQGARLLMGDRLTPATLRIEGGRITGIDTATDGATIIDATGLILAPALVDTHGDAFERQMQPRPGVDFPLHAALLETDRQLAANGIATAYHALTLSWEPGLRSVATGQAVFDSLQTLSPRLTVENRLQLRWETFCFEAIPLIEAALKGPLKPSIAFNDHTSMALLHPDTPLQTRPFDHDPTFPTVDMTTPAFAAKMSERAKRSHMTQAAFVDLIKDIWTRRPQVEQMIATVAAKGRAAGTPMLSHDDSQPETRAYYHALGSSIAEFPMNRSAAQAARDNGDWIAFGAPNAARGRSHLGSPGAGEMIRDGLCDILASDYFYPAMLTAITRLLADGIAPLPALWKLISTNPATASGLTDRGTLTPGHRADLVLLDWPEGTLPAVRQTWVAGRPAYRAEPSH
ncbi:MAG: alpha-D-ribose 1-methylphosphonate 5-triphosphate diphosphatase [Paracoccaceae bacterium]